MSDSSGRRRPSRRDLHPAGSVLKSRVRWSRGIPAPAIAPVVSPVVAPALVPDAATSPRAMATALEGAPRLPAGPGERYDGYGIVGLPFASGDVFALRRWPASSIGPAYTSVWHRDPSGRWTIYSDLHARYACPRYVGAMVDEAIVTPIHITWTAADSFTVQAPRVSLAWSVTLAATRATRTLDRLAAWMPAWAWRSPLALAAMGPLAGTLLGAGRLALTGRMPSGHRFRFAPRRVWTITDSRVRLGGRVLGPPTDRGEPVRLGDFRLPRRGVFAFGEAHFTPPG